MSFLFDRDFDAEAAAGLIPAPRPDAKPAPLSLTAEELAAKLQAAREEGYAQGHAEGLAEGQRLAQEDGAARARESLAALVPQISALEGDLSRHRAARERDLIRLTQALAARLLPEIAARFAPRRLAAFCRRALLLAEGPGGLTLEVPPAALEPLQAEFREALTGTGAAVHLIAAPDLAEGAARARWSGGEAHFHPEALMSEILATLDLLSRDAAQATTEGSDDHGQP